MTVEIRIHDTLLTARDNVVIPRVEMALKLIIGLTRDGTNSEDQNPDQKDFVVYSRNIRSCRPKPIGFRQ